MLIFIIDVIRIALICFLIYNIFALIARNSVNKKYDEKFNIKTTGTRSWGRKSLYNRTESTPYMALHHFSKSYEFSKEDHLVDFGCGKGRVAIFISSMFKIPVTAIELNDLTYEELENNVNSSNFENDVILVKEYAEKYSIKKDENKFFFFNPFDISIFKKIVENIIKDSIKNQKEVEIILYYPLGSYKKFLKKDTPFKFHEKINVSGSIGFKEKFLIYKFNPNVDSIK